MSVLDGFLERQRQSNELRTLRMGKEIAHKAALPGAREFAMKGYLQRTAVDNEVQLAEVLLNRYSYDEAAQVLMELNAGLHLTKRVAAAHVPRVWRNLEHPSSVLNRDEWLTLFALAGYTENYQTVDRPNEPITLYRGATYKHRYGLSWSEKKKVAGAFGDGHIWSGYFEPNRLLARITNASSGIELEYVADASGLSLDAVRGK